MDETWQGNAGQGEQVIIDQARQLLERAGAREAPGFVRQRLEDVGTLIAMLEDSE